MRKGNFIRVAVAALIAAACGGDSTGPIVTPVSTPTQLSLSIPPSSAAQSGVALPTQPAVRLRDAENRLVAKAGVVVTVVATGAGVTLTNATASTDGSGTATFSALTLTGLVGSYTLQFTATGLTALNAPALSLAAGVPTQLAVVTAPSSAAQAGNALAVQPVIQLRDGSGNAAAQTGVTVTATLVSGSATLAGATAQTTAGGLATFSGLTLSGATGSYTLRFGAPGLAAADAPAATVLASGPPTQIALTTAPSASATNGAVLATQPVVQLRDAFGNNATQSGATVIASVVSGPAGSTIRGDTAITDATGRAAFTALKITGTAGSYSLRFASAPLASVVSTTPTALAAGAATQLGIITVPSSSAQNGAALATQPVVQVQDQSGNAVAQAGVVVTASIFVGSGSLAGASATTDATGKATFSGLSISGTIGLFTLSFSAPSLTTANAPSVTLSPGAATGLSIQTQPSTAVANGAVLARQPVVRLVDASGNAVSQSGIIVTAATVSGTGSVGNGTATTSAAGVATFVGLTITGTTGGYTLRFSAASLTSADASAPTVLSAGGATQLGLSTQPPASGQSAQALAPATVIQLRDVSGNAVSQSGVVVTASIIGGGATLTGQSATTNASGVATFGALTVTGTAGAYTLRFSATGLTDADAAAPTVITAGVAAQLGITAQPPTAAQSGIALITQPVVQLQDNAGNARAQAGVVVTATVVSGTVAITNATATTDASGTATFSGLTLTGVAGSFTLRFTAAGLTAATAIAPTVLSAGSAVRLALTTQPSAAAPSGVALATQPVVQVQDASGNAVATSGVVVTASVVSGTVSFTSVTATTDVTGKATFSGLAMSALTGSYRLQFATPSLTSVAAAAPTVLSAGLPGAMTVTVQPSVSGNVGAALAAQPVIQLRDGAGNASPQAGVVVTASVVSGSVTLTNATSTTSASGVATFSGLTLAALTGSYTLRFGAPGLPTVDAAAATSLAVGAAARLSVAVQPSAGAVNGAVLATQPQIQLQDAGGNTVVTSGIVVTASAPGAAVSGNTATTNGSGLAAFGALAITGSATTHTLQFGAPGLVSTSAAIGTTLSPGAVASLFIVTSPPSSAVSGVPLGTPPEIEARDISGNPVAGVAVVVEVPGPLSIVVTNATQTTGAGGRALFTGLTISAPASGYSLRFCVGTTCASSSIVTGSPTPTAISTGAAAVLSIVTPPSLTAVNGTALASSPTVRVTDLGGNPIVGGTVTATTSAGVSITNGTATTNASGDVTFTNLTLTGTAGSYLLHFADGAAAADAAAATVVAAGAPSGVSVTTQPPATAVNGVVLTQQPIIMVTDASGNPVPGIAVTVTAVPPATISNGSATTDNAGNATFAGLAFTGTAGSYTLQFHAGAASAPAAAATALSAGSATTITVAAQPSASATNGVALAAQPVVHVTDGTNPVPGAIVTATAPGATVVNATATTNALGDATFTGLTLLGLAGSYRLQFAANALNPVPAAAVTTLAIGAATQLGLTTEPSTAAQSGIALATQPVVRVLDAGGALVTSGPHVVTASVLSGTAVIANATATSASGIATFSGLSISALAGGYRLVFTASGLAPDTAVAATVVSAGAAARLGVITSPSTTAIADSIWAQQPVIGVFDQAGNAVAAPGVNVTTGVAAGSPTFTGTTTALTDGLGHATFSGLAMRPAGSYTLRFTAPSLTAVDAPDSIVVATPLANNVPTTVTGGVISTQTLVIRVLPGDTLLRVVLDTLPGTSGDADLYVRFGDAANVAQDIHDCFPNLSGSNEVCTFTTASGTLRPGLWYISVYAFFAFANVTLTVTRQ